MNNLNPTDEVDILARTIYGEARGESLEAQIGVANTVINRVARGGWWGDTIAKVCLFPNQFSCWNKDDVNYGIIVAVNEEQHSFVVCQTIAAIAQGGWLVDLTNGATHYATLETDPLWAKGKSPCAVLGGHKFWNDIE